jgi:DNA-binding response OmpR family regulator
MPGDVNQLRNHISLLEQENRRLWAILTSHHVVLPMDWKLTPAEATIARQLLANPYVTVDRIESSLWGQRRAASPDNARQIISVYISKLRRKVPEFRSALRVRYGAGYYLEETARIQIARGAIMSDAA